MVDRFRTLLASSGPPDAFLYLAAMPLLLTASVATHANSSEPAVLLGYSAANLGSLGLVVIAVAIARKKFGALGKGKLWAIILFGLLLGALKAYSTAQFAVLLNLEESLYVGLADRAYTPAIGVISVLILTFVQGALRQFEETRVALILRKVRELQTLSTDRAEIANFLKQARSSVHTNQENAQQIIQLILNLVDHKLRPLISELWQSQEQSRQRFAAKELALGALRTQKYPAVLVGTVHGITSIPSTSLGANQNWLLASLVVGVLVATTLHLANLLRQMWAGFSSNHPIALWVLVGLTVGFIVVFTLQTTGLTRWASVAPLVLVTTLWCANLIVVIGSIKLAIQTDQGNKAELTESQLDSRLELSDSLGRRELANHLHSDLQNKLLAQVIRIRQSAEVDIDSELAVLEHHLASTFSQFPLEMSRSAVSDRWSGLIDIRWKLEREPDANMVAVIEEAITNAYRHGRARVAQVQLTDNRLVVIDDGIGPTRSPQGLGSQLFERLGHWRLVPGETGGSRLEIELH